MTELSNVVTVLIARMESHPEDFDTRGLGHVKFRGVADALDCLAGLTGMDKSAGNVYWFLTDTDKEALIEAWKKYHRTAMEKEVMELVFDEDYYERKEKERLYEEQMKQQMYQQRMAAQNQMLSASTGTYQTTTIQPGQIHKTT
jgi:hypothetical protein